MKRHVLRTTILLALAWAMLLGMGGQALALPLASWSPLHREPARDGVSSGAWMKRLGATRGDATVVRLVAIPVQFVKDVDPTTSGTGVFPYRTWGPASQPNYLYGSLQKLSEYYDEVSGHRIQIQPTLTKTVTLNDTMANYAADLSPLVTDEIQRSRLMRDVVEAVNTSVDFSQADVILLIHAGSGAEMSLDAQTSNLPTTYQVMKEWYIATNNGVQIREWGLVPETLCDDSFLLKANPTLDIQKYEAAPHTLPDGDIVTPQYWDVLGAWAHVVGHAFGMSDMYDTSYAGGTSLGAWSLMAEGWQLPMRDMENEPDAWAVPYDPARPYFASCPSHPDAWNKLQAGRLAGGRSWTSVVNVQGRMSQVRLEPQAVNGGLIYRLAKGGSDTGNEYFLAENRTQLGFDRYLPESGLMVYHVDDSVGSVLSNNLQWDREHPRVYPETANGQLEYDEVAEGFFQYAPGTGSAYPNAAGNTVFGPTSTPASLSYGSGATYVQIDGIQRVGNDIYANMQTTTPQSATVTFVDPAPSSVLYVSQPTLRANAPDIDPATLVLQLNGNVIRSGYTYDATTGELVGTFGTLGAGTYQVAISGTNRYLGTAISGSMQFRVEQKVLPAGMQMITIPAINVGTAADVFVGQGPLKLAWWNPSTGQYERYPAPTADLVSPVGAATESPSDKPVAPAGKGYWVDLSAATPLRLAGDQASNARQYEVPLVAGFNLVGNPFTYQVPFTSVMVDYNGARYTMAEAVSRKWVDPVLYTWNSYANGYTYAMLNGGVLLPWSGYWIYSHVGTGTAPLRLLFQPMPAGRAATATTVVRTAATPTSWNFALQARNQSAPGEALVLLGIAPDASEQADAGRDLYAPPAAPAGISLSSVTGRGDNLFADYRAPQVGGYMWTVRVTGTPGSRIAVCWPDLTGVPAETRLVLRDPVTKSECYLRTSASYALTLGDGETSRILTVAAEPASGAPLTISNLRAQRATRGSASIACDVSAPSRVDVEIRTVTGALVRRMTVEMAQGTTAISWDGKDSRGRRLPRGAYQCQVTATTASGQAAKAMALLTL